MANFVEVEMEALRRRLQKMRQNLTNPSPVMQKVSLIMYKDVMDHFNKEQGTGSKWVPIQYRKGKILQDTGNLKNSIKPSNTINSAVVGTNVIYGPTHNFGRGAIPQRKFLWISNDARSMIKKILGKFVIND